MTLLGVLAPTEGGQPVAGLVPGPWVADHEVTPAARDEVDIVQAGCWSQRCIRTGRCSSLAAPPTARWTGPKASNRRVAVLMPMRRICSDAYLPNAVPASCTSQRSLFSTDARRRHMQRMKSGVRRPGMDTASWSARARCWPQENTARHRQCAGCTAIRGALAS